MCLFFFFFFFSSRRRHTRCLSDWSSDVCSSDLVQPFTRGDQSPGAEVHLVASDTRGERIRFIAEFQIEEGLMDFQTVIISWSRPAAAPAPDGALQLGKDADSVAEMRVGVQQIALQQITIIVLRPQAEIELAEVFVANPRLAAERQVPAALVQRDIFQPVQPFRPPGFVPQIAPVLIIAQSLEGRRRGRGRRLRGDGQRRGRLRRLAESPYADAGDRDDHNYTEYSSC